MKIKQFIIILFCWAIQFSNLTFGAYPGSQAYNKPQLSQESINAATGTFDYSYPLISTTGRLSNFQLHLAYRFNKEGMFSLPDGWQLDLDYIKDKSAYIHGQSWLIDNLWRDETDYGSGLRYYNLHGTNFIDIGEANEIPGHTGVYYRYIATHKDGTLKYFSHEGLIVIEQDRFGNFIQFDYEQPIAPIEKARLKTVTDNYGNQYKFDYEPGELIVTSPDNKKTHVYHNKTGVIGIENALGQKTHINYFTFAEQNLLRTIETPKGLLTKLDYDTISYKKGDDVKQMPVVGLVEKIDLANNNKIEETHYTYSQDNNFTGYPMYNLSENGDSLMDSQNQGFRYSVEISRSELIGSTPQFNRKVYEYNYLHLPVEVRTLKNGKNHLKTTFDYAISPFKYSRSTNYDKPRETTNWVWDTSQGVYIPSDKVIFQYDNYGNKTEEKRHVFNRITSQWVSIHSQTKSYYNQSFGLEKEKLRIDELNNTAIRKTYELSKDKKSHHSKTIAYKNANDTEWKPWQKFTMVSDEFGRKTLFATEWIANDKPGPQKTAYTKAYSFDTSTKLLTVSQTSTLGAINTEVQDTVTGNIVKKQTAEGAIWLYEFDLLNRLTQETNPLGKSTLYTYQDFQSHNINQTTKETPMKYKIATITDALGRIIKHKDIYNNSWRRLSAIEYNGWNKIVKQTNILGLENTTRYDQNERPYQYIDHWGNIKRIDYNDLQLTTTAYLNKHKIMEKETKPWLATTIHRKYPIFDNSHDPQSYYLEETVKKNGFGQDEERTSMLVHRYSMKTMDAIKSSYQYDPSFNRISKTIKGFDGLDFKRLTEYDLFKNPVKHIKEQTVKDWTSKKQTDLLEYNMDNQLIAITTGENITTHFQNDKEGRRTKKINPDGQEIDYTYNPLGQLVTSRWMRGNIPYE
ncbi:MAG: hypothetical protein OXE99_09790, partial [Cellvibrionales bacterium]|nr:hypothetical protein [Cellvibrionales bacterium]